MAAEKKVSIPVTKEEVILSPEKRKQRLQNKWPGEKGTAITVFGRRNPVGVAGPLTNV